MENHLVISMAFYGHFPVRYVTVITRLGISKLKKNTSWRYLSMLKSIDIEIIRSSNSRTFNTFQKPPTTYPGEAGKAQSEMLTHLLHLLHLRHPGVDESSLFKSTSTSLGAYDHHQSVRLFFHTSAYIRNMRHVHVSVNSADPDCPTIPSWEFEFQPLTALKIF